jgi:hypothetical protein
MMNIVKTAYTETVRALDIDELEFVSGGVVIDLHAPDPTNPLCPEPHPILRPGNHKKA